MSDSNATARLASPTIELLTSTPSGVGGSKRPRCDLSGSFILEGPDGETSKISAPDLKSIIESAVTEAVETAMRRIQSALLESFNNKLESVEHRLQKLETENKAKDNLILDLKNQIQSKHSINEDFVNDEFEKIYEYAHQLESELNDIAQYTRKNNVKILGVPEKNEENCVEEVSAIIENSLGLHGVVIEVAHRLGRKRTMAQAVQSAKPRPIIVRLLKRNDKMSMMKARSNLKGSRISIHEDLTIRNQELLLEAQHHQDISEAWAWNAKIFARDIRGHIHQIRLDTDIDTLV